MKVWREEIQGNRSTSWREHWGLQHVRIHVRYLLGEALALALALLRPPGPGVLDQQYVNVVNSGVPISQKTLTGTVPY